MVTCQGHHIHLYLQVCRARNTIDADVCVVGAGIVGLAHALEASPRGMRGGAARARRSGGRRERSQLRALLLLGDGRRRSRSSARCGLAERWLELGRRAGLAVLESGSLVVARHEDELTVMESVARDERRGARMISAEEMAALAPIPADGVIGALHARLDVRVDPREAVAALASLLRAGRNADCVARAGARGRGRASSRALALGSGRRDHRLSRLRLRHAADRASPRAQAG